MDLTKTDLELSTVRKVVIEACAIHALRKEIKERIPDTPIDHLTDQILGKGKIKVHGEYVSTTKMLSQLRNRYINSLDDGILEPIVGILRLRRRAIVVGKGPQYLRVPSVIQALSNDERSCLVTDVGDHSVVYFIGNDYMVVANKMKDYFSVIALHGFIRNLLSGFNLSAYHTLTPQTIYLTGKNVETVCGLDGVHSVQRLILMKKGSPDVRLQYPSLNTLLNSADGLNKRNWNQLLKNYKIPNP